MTSSEAGRHLAKGEGRRESALLREERQYWLSPSPPEGQPRHMWPPGREDWMTEGWGA